MGSKAATKGTSRTAWFEGRGGAATTATSCVTVIGGGRIGNMLMDSAGPEDKLLKRGDVVDANGAGPVFIATRNDSLQAIVDECPEGRRKDLVFLQNGYLDNFLEKNGLGENTQSLLFVAVTSLGADPIDGITSVNPEGLTAATGEHAEALKERLASVDMKCNVLSPEEYRPAMFEKLIWISTYMLVGAAKECESVGEAGSEHTDLVSSVISELVAAVSAKEGIEFKEGTIERLAAYTDVVTNFPCAVKEFEWRNQYFFDLGDEACPTHNGLLRECEEKGFLSFELPK
eukprot:CAMPEP_0113298916 /NCGR_PEP_ID=MMETSP0010_2-20120614/1159_1 /TAXON_ID=216773 ORGANISM="Corethron hystrix, Strain 308" /NCGR_SAMPLE_ID=MMETSP0010_2 /ASSEMBLY_ACC=CAM_ASM_000155 /LENGTH=287 /DNA_ID=CAMNT_0000152045 /DNA_START=180 /DNA_END=1043 /DNA_ORIENTATION=- /assembly_acc=CAM_ASM_000155